jgi:tyrosyl-tRNA synthetase
VNTEDADVVKYLKYFSLLSQDEISELDQATQVEAHRRAAQKALAEDVTRRVHGETGLAKAVQATAALFGGDLSGLSAEDIQDVFADVPSSEIMRDRLSGEGVSFIDLLVESAVASSKGDARRSIEGGGVYLNNVRIQDVEFSVEVSQAIDGRFLVIRKGKKNYHLVALQG